MRIGIDATTIYTPRPTGLGVYSINVINEMAKLHDDIVVWTVDDTLLTIDKSKIRHAMRPLSFLGNELFQLRPFWVETMLPRYIRQEKVDVLYSTIPNGLLRSPVPHVLTVHDLIPLTFPADSPRSVRWNFQYRLPRIFESATRIIAVSEFTKKDIQRWFGIATDKICTVKEGYDCATFVPREGREVLQRYTLENKKYILYVGSASPRKNLINLIQAFAMIKSDVPHKLALVGPKSQEEMRTLLELIRGCNVEERVSLINYVPYQDLPALFCGATVFVYPSLYEGFGLPVLEAMACGVPIIASDTTSIPEVTEDAALLVDPTEPRAIADACRTILADDGLRSILSLRGRMQAEKFSWNRAAAQILDILKQSESDRRTQK